LYLSGGRFLCGAVCILYAKVYKVYKKKPSVNTLDCQPANKKQSVVRKKEFVVVLVQKGKYVLHSCF
jgi:hypothetical protein